MDKGNNEPQNQADFSSVYNDIFDDNSGLEPKVNEEEIKEEKKEPEFNFNNNSEPNIIEEVLKYKNIDINSIKFENEEGVLEEYKWDDLSLDEQKNIILSNELDNDYGLDDNEVTFINNFRESKLSYEDYIDNIKKQAVEQYLQENNPYQVYTVDEYSDDELYLLDLKSRTPDLTDEELVLALENEKTNETLYNKKVSALRNEYKELEVEKIKAEEELEEQENLRAIEEFESTIKSNVSKLDSIGNLQLSDEEKNNIYNFITGTNAAGERLISNALNDPEQLVKMAWFNLYGEQGFDVIKDYFTKELANSRKETKGNKSTVVYTSKDNTKNNKQEVKEIKTINSLYSLDD